MQRVFLVFGVVIGMFATASAQTDDRSRGIELYLSGNYAEAATVLQKVVDAEPANKVAWTYLGGALENLGKKKEALAAFKKPGGGDKFPFKYDKEPKVLRKPNPSYTNEARSDRVSGSVLVAVEFRSDGKIGFTVPIKILPGGLTANAVSAARQVVFEPAVINGKPVSVIRFLSYSFNTY